MFQLGQQNHRDTGVTRAEDCWRNELAGRQRVTRQLAADQPECRAWSKRKSSNKWKPPTGAVPEKWALHRQGVHGSNNPRRGCSNNREAGGVRSSELATRFSILLLQTTPPHSHRHYKSPNFRTATALGDCASPSPRPPPNFPFHHAHAVQRRVRIFAFSRRPWYRASRSISPLHALRRLLVQDHNNTTRTPFGARDHARHHRGARRHSAGLLRRARPAGRNHRRPLDGLFGSAMLTVSLV